MRFDELILEQLEPIPPFSFKWPEAVEQYDKGWRATAVVGGKRYTIRHGLGHRVTYGRSLRRGVTWLGQTIVEGVEAKDYAASRALVSLLRRDGKVILDFAGVGRAYEGFSVVRYADEVAADKSSTYGGVAVKLFEDDVRSWAFHVLVRGGVIDAVWPSESSATIPLTGGDPIDMSIVRALHALLARHPRVDLAEFVRLAKESGISASDGTLKTVHYHGRASLNARSELDRSRATLTASEQSLAEMPVVRDLYEERYSREIASGGGHKAWIDRYAAVLASAAAMSNEQLRDPTIQGAFWDGEQKLGGIGPGEFPYFSDKTGFNDFVRVAAAVVASPLPANAAARSAELRRRYDELTSQAMKCLGTKRLQHAKVLRFLAAFHPADICSVFSPNMARTVAAALSGTTAPQHPADAHAVIAQALNRALGTSASDPVGLATRATFPWWILTRVLQQNADAEPSATVDVEPGTVLTAADESSSQFVDVPSWESPSLDELVARFDDLTLVFPRELIVRLHIALHANEHKHFVLLSGLSGTGKTQLARSYANLIHGLAQGAPNPYLEVVPVQPDWTDPSALLGYVNPLRDRPSYEWTDCLKFLLSARGDERPRFLVLDEMNLARPEHYFAPFLSAMETSAPLVVHGQPGIVDLVPPRIPWPRNLFIIGTVNMDETTHGFSDKLLDRAFTIELWDVDLTAFRAKVGGIYPNVADAAFEVFGVLQHELLPLRAHVGYRNLEEILRFLEGNAQAGAAGLGRVAAMDLALMMKVLPRLRGEDSPRFRAGLEAVRKLCAARGFDLCAAKLASMHEELVATGTTRFWS